jgi:hypothetical protein
MENRFHLFHYLVSGAQNPFDEEKLDAMADTLLPASSLHFISFFNILYRAHRISQQLRHLSTLTLRDIERGEKVSLRVNSVKVADSAPKSPAAYSARECRRKTMTETITAIRTPCAELEGSNRWTIVSEKSIDHS